MKNIPDLQTIFTYLIPFLVFSSLLVDRSQCAPTVEGDEVDGGCYYMFNHYGEGDRILTNEPCLNCTCHNSMLMCYLRVCPFTKPIGQDCTVEKKPDQCCPVISCPQVPVSLVTPSTLTSTTMSTTSLASVTESTELAPYERGCEIEGKHYSDGAQIIGDPSKPCELCYCIRNKTACVMQECILHVKGCEPVFQPGVCCPVRYQCDYNPLQITDQSTVAEMITTTISSIFSPAPLSGSCVLGGKTYADGSQIPGAGPEPSPCEHCYCMRGEVVCAVQECGAPLENEGANCTAIPPGPGLCCPEKYTCESDKQILGDDYMTTILPPQVPEAIDPENDKQEIPSSDQKDDGTTESPSVSNITGDVPSQSTSPSTEFQGDDVMASTESAASSSSQSSHDGVDILVGDASNNSSEMEIHNLEKEKPVSLTPLESMGDDKVGSGNSGRPLVEGIKNSQLAPEDTPTSTENAIRDQPAVTSSPSSDSDEAAATSQSSKLGDEPTSENVNVDQPGQHDDSSSNKSGSSNAVDNVTSEQVPDFTESSSSAELPTDKLYASSTEKVMMDPEATTTSQYLADEPSEGAEGTVTSSESPVSSSTESSSTSSAQESSTEAAFLPGAQPVESETGKPLSISQETSTEAGSGEGADDSENPSAQTTERPNVSNDGLPETAETGTEKPPGFSENTGNDGPTNRPPAAASSEDGSTDRPVVIPTVDDNSTEKTIADSTADESTTGKPAAAAEDGSNEKTPADAPAESSSTDKPTNGISNEENSTEKSPSFGEKLPESSSEIPSESSTENSSIADGIPSAEQTTDKETLANVEQPTEPTLSGSPDDAVAATTMKPSNEEASESSTNKITDENVVKQSATDIPLSSQSYLESSTVKTAETSDDSPVESSTDVAPEKGSDETAEPSTENYVAQSGDTSESSTEKGVSSNEKALSTSTEKSSQSSSNQEGSVSEQSTEQSGVSTEGSPLTESSTDKSQELGNDSAAVSNDKPAPSDISFPTESFNEVPIDSTSTESSAANDGVTAASNADVSDQENSTDTGILNKLTNMVSEFFTTTMKSVTGSQDDGTQADDQSQTTLSPVSDSPASSTEGASGGDQDGTGESDDEKKSTSTTGESVEVTTRRPASDSPPASLSAGALGDDQAETGTTLSPSGDETKPGEHSSLSANDTTSEESSTGRPHDHEGIVMGMETISSTPEPAQSLAHPSSTEKTPPVLPDVSESENEIDQDSAANKVSTVPASDDTSSSSSSPISPVSEDAVASTSLPTGPQESDTDAESSATTLSPATGEVSVAEDVKVMPGSSDENAPASDNLGSSTTSTGSESATTIPSVSSNVLDSEADRPISDDQNAVIDVSGEDPAPEDKPKTSSASPTQAEVTTVRTTDDESVKSSTSSSSDSNDVPSATGSPDSDSTGDNDSLQSIAHDDSDVPSATDTPVSSSSVPLGATDSNEVPSATDSSVSGSPADEDTPAATDAPVSISSAPLDTFDGDNVHSATDASASITTSPLENAEEKISENYPEVSATTVRSVDDESHTAQGILEGEKVPVPVFSLEIEKEGSTASPTSSAGSDSSLNKNETSGQSSDALPQSDDAAGVTTSSPVSSSVDTSAVSLDTEVPSTESSLASQDDKDNEISNTDSPLASNDNNKGADDSAPGQIGATQESDKPSNSNDFTTSSTVTSDEKSTTDKGETGQTQSDDANNETGSGSGPEEATTFASKTSDNEAETAGQKDESELPATTISSTDSKDDSTSSQQDSTSVAPGVGASEGESQDTKIGQVGQGATTLPSAHGSVSDGPSKTSSSDDQTSSDGVTTNAPSASQGTDEGSQDQNSQKDESAQPVDATTLPSQEQFRPDEISSTSSNISDGERPQGDDKSQDDATTIPSFQQESSDSSSDSDSSGVTTVSSADKPLATDSPTEQDGKQKNSDETSGDSSTSASVESSAPSDFSATESVGESGDATGEASTISSASTPSFLETSSASSEPSSSSEQSDESEQSPVESSTSSATEGDSTSPIPPSEATSSDSDGSTSSAANNDASDDDASVVTTTQVSAGGTGPAIPSDDPNAAPIPDEQDAPAATTLAPLQDDSSSDAPHSPMVGTDAAQSPVAGGDSTQSPASTSDSTQSLVSGGDSTQSLVSGGDSTQSPVSGGDSTQSSVSGGDSTQSSVSGGDSTQSLTPGGDSTQSPVSGGDSTQSPASTGDSTQSLASGGDSTQSLTPGGDSTQSPVSGGDSTQSPASTGDSTQSLVSGGDSTQSPVSGGDSTQSPVAGGDSTQSSVSGGDSTQSSVSGGDSTQSPVSGGDSTQSSVSGGDSTQSPVSGGDSTQSSVSGGDSTQSSVSGGDPTQSPASTGDSTQSPVSGSSDSTQLPVSGEEPSDPINHDDQSAQTESPQGVTEPSPVAKQPITGSSQHEGEDIVPSDAKPGDETSISSLTSTDQEGSTIAPKLGSGQGKPQDVVASTESSGIAGVSQSGDPSSSVSSGDVTTLPSIATDEMGQEPGSHDDSNGTLSNSGSDLESADLPTTVQTPTEGSSSIGTSEPSGLLVEKDATTIKPATDSGEMGVTTVAPNMPDTSEKLADSSAITSDSDSGEDSRVPGEGTCFVEGKTYQNGSSIPPTTPCHLVCACQNSIVHCLLVHCPPPPNTGSTRDCKPVYKSGVCCPDYDCGESDSMTVTVTPGPGDKDENLVTVTPESTLASTSETYQDGGLSSGNSSESLSSSTSEPESSSASSSESSSTEGADHGAEEPISHGGTANKQESSSIAPTVSTTASSLLQSPSEKPTTEEGEMETGGIEGLEGAPIDSAENNTSSIFSQEIMNNQFGDDIRNVTGEEDDGTSGLSPGNYYPVTTTTTVTPSSAAWPYPTSTPASVMSTGACLFDGRVYMSAQQIPRDDPCDFCFCFRGDIICLQQSCPPPIPGCYEEPIPGFCCPRYECPVGNGNVTTQQPPLFPPSYYHNQILNGVASGQSIGAPNPPPNAPIGPGCEIQGEYYESGQVITSTSGPCLECRCGATGMMECDPRECQPEPMLRKMIAAITSR